MERSDLDVTLFIIAQLVQPLDVGLVPSRELCENLKLTPGTLIIIAIVEIVAALWSCDVMSDEAFRPPILKKSFFLVNLISANCDTERADRV